MFEENQRIDLARRGDHRAWAEIVREVGSQIQGFARARGVAQPEDLMQDVLVAAAERLPSFEGDWAAFRRWIFSIAYRRIADAHRTAYRRPRPAPLEAARAAAAGPESLVLDRSRSEASLEALEVLSPIERDVVMLRIIAGMDTASVAAVVGKKPGTVRVIQSRAVEKLRRELKQWA